MLGRRRNAFRVDLLPDAVLRFEALQLAHLGRTLLLGYPQVIMPA